MLLQNNSLRVSLLLILIRQSFSIYWLLHTYILQINMEDIEGDANELTT